jgi:hypothetical protein
MKIENYGMGERIFADVDNIKNFIINSMTTEIKKQIEERFNKLKITMNAIKHGSEMPDTDNPNAFRNCTPFYMVASEGGWYEVKDIIFIYAFWEYNYIKPIAQAEVKLDSTLEEVSKELAINMYDSIHGKYEMIDDETAYKRTFKYYQETHKFENDKWIEKSENGEWVESKEQNPFKE